MAKTLREGSQGVVHLVSAAARTAGTPVVERGWAGIPMSTVAINTMYSLDCRVGVKYEITRIGAETTGDFIYITVVDNSLTLTPAVGKKLFAKVVEPENGTNYNTPAGKTLIMLLPQAVTQ